MLGAVLSIKLTKSQDVNEFNNALDDEILKSVLERDSSQMELPGKPGRQIPFQPGTTVHLTTKQGPIILTSLTHVGVAGSNYKVILDEETLFSGLRNLWKSIELCPVRNDLYMPLIGSGFGGITRMTALAHILLSYRAAEASAKRRLCDSLTIVVYHRNWGDGNWVRHLFEGLMY